MIAFRAILICLVLLMVSYAITNHVWNVYSNEPYRNYMYYKCDYKQELVGNLDQYTLIQYFYHSTGGINITCVPNTFWPHRPCSEYTEYECITMTKQSICKYFSMHCYNLWYTIIYSIWAVISFIMIS